ncbi:hypothetical protein BCR39DRAFT_541053 [Naematelia encephala]|uniref:Hyaluronan/mRNA-binding protein domain-containing protein n=1 Tax=Naematelia encephala TaxID=71784 RepID=A0A1Y2AW36_9TREE|nr:hypothetical protein BCR39DRAFT_541053 [Naematelia encephala]
MTRTERNQYPAALVKDKHSRSGLDNQLRKNGAGAHNWGSYRERGQHEISGDHDADVDLSNANFEDGPVTGQKVGDGEIDDLAPLPKINGNGDGQIVHNVDLAKEVISTSPTDSMSSIDSPGVVRRMSGVSEEERKEAGVFRKRALSKGDVNLNDIARTSYGVQSPPIPASSSPIKNKGSYFK